MSSFPNVLVRLTYGPDVWWLPLPWFKTSFVVSVLFIQFLILNLPNIATSLYPRSVFSFFHFSLRFCRIIVFVFLLLRCLPCCCCCCRLFVRNLILVTHAARTPCFPPCVSITTLFIICSWPSYLLYSNCLYYALHTKKLCTYHTMLQQGSAFRASITSILENVSVLPKDRRFIIVFCSARISRLTWSDGRRHAKRLPQRALYARISPHTTS